MPSPDELQDGQTRARLIASLKALNARYAAKVEAIERQRKAGKAVLLVSSEEELEKERPCCHSCIVS